VAQILIDPALASCNYGVTVHHFAEFLAVELPADNRGATMMVEEDSYCTHARQH
jgi:hypothetical protein